MDPAEGESEIRSFVLAVFPPGVRAAEANEQLKPADALQLRLIGLLYGSPVGAMVTLVSADEPRGIVRAASWSHREKPLDPSVTTLDWLAEVPALSVTVPVTVYVPGAL